MKKVVLITVLAVFSLGLFISCGSERNKPNASSAEKSAAIDMNVSPERNGGAPQSLDLTIQNNTGGVIQFGADYTIEHLIDDQWMKVDLGDLAFITIMYSLQPGESGNYKISLYPQTVSYPEGDYRIVKQIFQEGKDAELYYSGFRIIEPR